jgi:hypothetical protein
MKYRYRLERIMGPGPSLGIVMINPAEATEEWDDPTIACVQTLCSRFGFGRAIIGNLFGYRDPDVLKLASIDDPIGPENDDSLEGIARDADTIVVAWGAHKKAPAGHENRWRDVVRILERSGKDLYCLRHLSGDHPAHPLYLRHETPLPLWRRPA